MTEKPLVSVCLVCYNQEGFVLDALKSILNQNYDNIQYIISDDCSTDGTYEAIQRYIKNNSIHSPNKIIINRNPVNLGVVGHINKLVEEFAAGEYVFLQAGDDISAPDRIAKVVESFNKTGASAVAVNPVMIDSSGNKIGRRFFDKFPTGVLRFNDFFVKSAPFFGGGGYHINVFRKYGPMSVSARNEDCILPLRASVDGGVGYIHDPVYFYREHEENMSFWVKIKNDPKNKQNYKILSAKNYVTNLENFANEIGMTNDPKLNAMVQPFLRERITATKLYIDAMASPAVYRYRFAMQAARTAHSPMSKIKIVVSWIFPDTYEQIGMFISMVRRIYHSRFSRKRVRASC